VAAEQLTGARWLSTTAAGSDRYEHSRNLASALGRQVHDTLGGHPRRILDVDQLEIAGFNEVVDFIETASQRLSGAAFCLQGTRHIEFPIM
jgi:hypothetical protein